MTHFTSDTTAYKNEKTLLNALKNDGFKAVTKDSKGFYYLHRTLEVEMINGEFFSKFMINEHSESNWFNSLNGLNKALMDSLFSNKENMIIVKEALASIAK